MVYSLSVALRKQWQIGWTFTLSMVFAVLLPAVAWASDPAHGDAVEHADLGDFLPFWSVLPFAGLLLSIALMPIFAEHFWHKTQNQLLVAVGWASPVFAYLIYLLLTDEHGLAYAANHGLAHAIAEYVSFIALLGSLYVISGGILLRGDLQAKPTVNTTFLLIGAVLANVIGTTGASMLLIRPMLRTNADRKHVWHIPLFFIFLVSNIGGALTPIGDPPLFLGYLRGVPFFWTLFNLWHIWLPVILVLLVMFFVLDTIMYKRESPEDLKRDDGNVEPLGLEGNLNFLLLGGVIAAVLLLSPDSEHPGFRDYYVREIAMFGLAGISMALTSRSIRERNKFEWGPIAEVGALFLGIFVAMIPATALLQVHGTTIGLSEPWQYFWATGGLSAFLDNAPTYVTFASLACSDPTIGCTAEALGPLASGPSAEILVAISLGAVFCGAGSYIGNGPNFMVRAIAESSGYKMPSFFGYVGYATVFLAPVFILVTLIWLL
ncbi:MAG: Na+/H+ antiporter NhaD/arsenite permease-like protein [Myxococcota bacterium]